MNSYKSKIVNLLVSLHTTFHWNSKSEQVTIFRSLYLTYHIELIVLLLQKESKMQHYQTNFRDIVQFVQQINVNITYISNHIAFLVIHLIILIILAIGIFQKAHTVNHTTINIYYYLLSIPIFKNCINIHQNTGEIMIKCVNVIIQIIILITVTFFKRPDNFIERNSFLQNIRYRFLLYLEHCLVLMILIVNQFSINQEIVKIIFISKMIITIINVEYLHQSSLFVAGSSLQFLAIAIFSEENSINLLSALLLGIVLINIYRQIAYWKIHDLILKPNQNQIKALIFLEDSQYCKNKYAIQQMLIKIQLNNSSSKSLIEEIIKRDVKKEYTVQITNYLVGTQLIRGLNYLKLNISKKLYQQIAKLSIEQLYNQQIVQTDSSLSNLYNAYSETEIKKIEIIKDVIKAKIQFYKQLKTLSITQQALYLNCKLLGERINQANALKFGQASTFHQFKFLELYYQLIINNKIESIKYGIQAAKCFIRNSIDIDLERGKSIFLSSDYETLGRIKPTESIQKFFQNSNTINHIKQIMPEFIAERHDELLKQFLISGDSKLLQSNLATFYTGENQFIQPCKIQQFMTLDYAHMHIIFTKEYDPNSYIIFDTNGNILGYTQDMDVVKGETIFNYINIKQNLILLKQEIQQQNQYKLDNLESEMYWFNSCNRRINEQTSTLCDLNWPLLNINIKINNQDLNREIKYSLQYQIFRNTLDQFSYFVIEINNQIDASSSQSSSTVKLANFISQINLRSEPKFIENKMTTQYADFKNNQTTAILNSPMNSQAPLQFNKTSQPQLLNAQQSECSSISGRKPTLINQFSNCSSFRAIRNLKVILTIFISIFISYCMANVFLVRNLLNLQIIDLQKVTHVQLLNYGLLREFYTKYINLQIQHQYLYLDEELSLYLFEKEQQIIEYNRQTITKNSIIILKQTTQPELIINGKELHIFEFYNMFYQDLKENLQGNYSEKYIVEFIKYNDEDIDHIVSQVVQEFLEIRNPLLTIALIYIGSIIIIQIYIFQQLRVIEHYYSLIMICIANIEDYVVVEELQFLERILLRLQQWTKINFEDYESKLLQHHNSLNQKQKSLIYELEIPRTRVRNYLVMLILMLISVGMIISGYIFLLSQINQFEYYFQLNYRSVQLQQHFMATSTMGEIIKTNKLMFEGHEEILIDLFIDHFSYELPYQIADIYQFLLQMGADSETQLLVTDDMCKLLNLHICKSRYSEIVNHGIQGFNAQFVQMILTDFQFENKTRTFENNITNQIRWINTINNKQYFLYYILDISESIQDLIQYSYDFIDQKYSEIDWLLFLYFFGLYTIMIILISVFVKRWIVDEEDQLLKFRSILKIIPEEQQQKTIININIRRLLRESI